MPFKPSQVSDAELGAQVRAVVEKFPKEFETEAAMAAACLMMISYFGHVLKAEDLKLSIEDITHEGEKIGSWSARLLYGPRDRRERQHQFGVDLWGFTRPLLVHFFGGM